MSHSAPVYHFAHANGFPANSYQQLFAALPDAWHRISIDKFGHNTQLPVNANWRNQVAEMINYIESHRPGNQPVIAIGHSFGAVVSYMAACEAPELFSGLIMLDPPLVTGLPSALFKLAKFTPLIDRLTPASLAVTRRTRWPNSTDMAAYFAGKGLFKNMDPRCIRDYVNAVIAKRGEHWQLTFDADIEAALFRNVPHNLHRYYGRLQCPATLVVGADSKVCRPAMRQRFLKGNKMTNMKVAGGHMFPLEHPEKVAATLQQIVAAWPSEVS
ncbi:alpha/beta hydrolase [Alteromonas sp. ASW11-19]|uniref:Alpha/beta hydrolase n=1 Tax=Alteromonas salexigens TaxID=2982530 RepID=A0ABT2VKU2_9ALTE|nr:alpha/beta hydrolase [Alteromonas salexigens]MCU7553917.1 alpha/beta hydrolase [Alteromonas salexigens]